MYSVLLIFSYRPSRAEAGWMADPLTGLGEDAWLIALFYDGQRFKLYIRQRGAYLPSIGVLSFIFEWSAINGEGDVVLV